MIHTRRRQPSHIRVERAATRGAAAGTRRGRSARQARAGRPEHHHPKPRPGKSRLNTEAETCVIRRPAARHGVTGRQLLGPTRWRVARNEHTCDSDGPERVGGEPEEAAARATTSQAKTCLANRPTSYHRPHGADAKASSIGTGFVPGGGEGTRRYAIKEWS